MFIFQMHNMSKKCPTQGPKKAQKSRLLNPNSRLGLIGLCGSESNTKSTKSTHKPPYGLHTPNVAQTVGLDTGAHWALAARLSPYILLLP